MIVKPKVRGFICTTAHPVGCEQNIKDQIAYVRNHGVLSQGPKSALVIGCSTGYGLASRIEAAFGCGAGTVGVCFERPAEGKRTATAGWYNTAAFDRLATAEGLSSASIVGDAFADDVKDKVVQALKDGPGPVDLVVYSVAAPRKTDARTGEVFKSILKPCGKSYTNKSIDLSTNEVIEVTLEAASEEEVKGTVAVMGGDDWKLWIDRLKSEGLLADGCVTIAYSYIGPEVTTPVYRNGTIGAAKDHLEATAKQLDDEMKEIGGRALVSVNKALVTQSSSAIPFIPLYFVILLKVMKQKGVDEGCIEQIVRLFRDRLYTEDGIDRIPVDEDGRIRIDDWELREDIQQEVDAGWRQVDSANLRGLADIDGYNEEFLRLFGFGSDQVDYDADVEVDVPIPGS